MALQDLLRSIGIGSLILAGLVVIWPDHGANALPKESEHSTVQLRRPVALALADKSKTLFVANRASGTITTIDVEKGRILSETSVGGRLADLCLTSDEKHLLVLNEEKNELLVLTRAGPVLKLTGRVSVPDSPVSVKPAPDGHHYVVASLWARQLTVLDFAEGEQNTRPLTAKKNIDLPFAPRVQLSIPKTDKVVVADAFGGKLAVVDVVKGVVDSVRSLPAHQIRGLAWSSDGSRLFVTHQILRANAHTSEPDIHWGNLMVNCVRSLSRAELLKPEADLLGESRLFPLGDVDRGTGDPAGIAVAADGTMIVALGGIAEVAIGKEKKGDWSYVSVGRRPTAVVLDSAGKTAFVADQFSDRITVVDLARKTKSSQISLGKQRDLNPSERGELLFYDATRSLEGWISCNSCHVDGHTNSLLNDNLSDGSFGTPKRVLTLLGVKDTAPWAWNGGVSELKEQVRKSLVSTMRGPKPTDGELQDLEAFLRTLAPPPPFRFESATTKDGIHRGNELFAQLGCNVCHVPPVYTSAKTYDVGLADEMDNRKYNPPSLRGVGQGGPYFHDNRSESLEAVFTVHKHQIKKELSKEELADLLTFLRSL